MSKGRERGERWKGFPGHLVTAVFLLSARATGDEAVFAVRTDRKHFGYIQVNLKENTGKDLRGQKYNDEELQQLFRILSNFTWK